MEGGCLCGRVRYEARGAPMRSYLCHCRDCQRAGGSAFAAAVMFPAEAVSVQGELRAFSVTAESGEAVYRHFCPQCGSGVINTGPPGGEAVVVLAGTLDDPSGFAPDFELFCQSAQPWVHAESARTRLSRGR